MLKQILIAVPLAITASAGSDCFSQSDVAKNDSILDSAEAEFREAVLEALRHGTQFWLFRQRHLSM